MTLTNVVTIKSKNGMHLRPAGVLSQISSKTDYANIGIFLLYNGVRAYSILWDLEHFKVQILY